MLCCVEIICDDEDYDCDVIFISLIDLITIQFVTIGCRNSHPFIISSTFTYNNSDGSGPYISFPTDSYDALGAMQTYYDKFCDNCYH